VEDGSPASLTLRSVLLYYITDRTQFPGDEAARRRQLLDKIAEAARAGVDFIQLREKNLSTRDLESLVRAAVVVVRENSQLETRLLVNSRTDVAIACGADGVHLRSNDVSPSEVRNVWMEVGKTRELNSPAIGVSCHTLAEIARAASQQASLAVLGPVFEKQGDLQTRFTGLESLTEACSHKIPVLALGGITLKNARACVDAGAAGVAGIRLFQDNVVTRVVRELRG
jgi:thiamine-phosphate pyrophosphorylase